MLDPCRAECRVQAPWHLIGLRLEGEADSLSRRTSYRCLEPDMPLWEAAVAKLTDIPGQVAISAPGKESKGRRKSGDLLIIDDKPGFRMGSSRKGDGPDPRVDTRVIPLRRWGKVREYQAAATRQGA
jgi:hypothetical protein